MWPLTVVCVCVSEVAACEPLENIMGCFYVLRGDRVLKTDGEGKRGPVLCEPVKGDVFVSLDTFIYKGIKAKRSIKLECMF